MSLGLKYSNYFLYIEFHRTLNQDAKELLEQLQEICPFVTNVRRPRQGNAKFCFVHFDSEEEQFQAKEIFEKMNVYGQKIVVKLPLDKNSEEYKAKQERIQQRRLAKKSASRMKNKAKKIILTKSKIKDKVE